MSRLASPSSEREFDSRRLLSVGRSQFRPVDGSGGAVSRQVASLRSMAHLRSWRSNRWTQLDRSYAPLVARASSGVAYLNCRNCRARIEVRKSGHSFTCTECQARYDAIRCKKCHGAYLTETPIWKRSTCPVCGFVESMRASTDATFDEINGLLNTEASNSRPNTPVNNAPAKKAPAKQTPAKKASAKQTPAKEAPAKQTPGKKSGAVLGNSDIPKLITVAAAVVPGLVALGVCAYQLSLPHVLFGYHYSTGNPYDDGVYLGAALHLVNGVLPYRDFVLLHPPGVPLLMTPVAALGRLIGTRDAMAWARVVTVLVAALNAVLAAIAVRHRGVGAMMIAGTALACFPLAVAADQSLLLEPYLVCFCLIGTIAMFSGGKLASSHRLALAGVAFGFAGACKIWAIFPILVALVVCLPRWKDLRTLVLGAIAGFVVPCLPFFVLAPYAFFHDVFVTQLAHTASGTAGASSSVRLLTLTGFWGISFLHTKTALALCFAIVLVILVSLVYGFSAFSPNTRADWFVLGCAVVTTTVMFLPSSYFDHYAYFPAAFVALLLGSCVSRAIRAFRTLDERFMGHLGYLVVPALVSLVAIAVLVPEQVSYARSYLSVSPEQPGTVVSRLTRPGACVVSNIVSVIVLADRFDPAKEGCPAVVDPFGVWQATFPSHPPPYPGPYPEPFVAKWGQWLNRASDVVLVGAKNGDLIPWSTELTSWFNNTFQSLYSQPGFYVYKHVGRAPPPA
jgi:hypothetical protein